jgi:hypothetical protein
VTLWIAYNGWFGEGPVGAIVEARDEASARAIASSAFRAEAERDNALARREVCNPGHYSRIASIRKLELPYVGDSL